MIKRFLPVLVAGVMGLVAVLLTQYYLNRKQLELDRQRKELETLYKDLVQIVVAQENVPEGTTLQTGHVTRSAIPKKFVQPYTTSRVEELLGLVTTAPIAKGEQIMGTKLRRPGETTAESKLSELTPQGKRAVTVATDVVSAVGGFVRPGDTVDVLWTISVPQASGQGSELATMTLFQDVTVLTVGNQLPGQKAPKEGTLETTNAVTLALSPQEASFLLFAKEQGKIQLSLRSRLDKGHEIEVAPTNMKSLMQSLFLKIRPNDSPKSQHNVERFKGLERSTLPVNEWLPPRLW